jgi:predicted nucleotidyltransferase
MKSKVSRIVKDLRTKPEAIEAERLKSMILFGLLARGDAAPRSKSDVLVDTRQGRVHTIPT